MAVQLELLKSTLYFSGLNHVELNSISKLILEKTASRAEMILLEGEPAEILYFVVSGVVKIIKTSVEGKDQILTIVRPGQPLNDVSIFSDGLNLISAQAMGAAILYGIKKDDLKAVIQEHRQIALNVIKALASRAHQLMSLVEDLSFRRVISRVAKILLEHAGDGHGPNPRLTQQDMAAMAGTAREVVGRSLKTLEEEGIIRLDHHRIVIINKEVIKQMIEASP